MKKIYTFFWSKALCLSLVSILLTATTFGQICGSILEDFNNTGGTTAGFTGDFSYEKPGANGYLIKRNVIPNGLYTVTTPTYQLLPGSTYVGFGFLIEGTEKVARVEAVITYQSTLNNQITNVFLTQFVPTYGIGTTATVCRTVDLSEMPGFPASGRYRLRFELTPNTGNGQAAQYFTFDDFRTNASPAQFPLPVTFIGFDAKKLSTGAQLTWKVGGEENVARYELERSTDGKTFTTVASIPTTRKDTYTYLDANNSSVLYYRVKNVDNDGAFKYSTIVRLVNGKSETVIKAFPQPVLNHLTVQHPYIKGNSLLTIATADGRIIKSVKPSTGTMQTYLDMTTLQKGMYIVRFDAGDGNVETMKVLKQ